MLAIFQGTYNLFFGGWPALPVDRLVSDETATFANTDIQCYINVAKYSHFVGLLQQRFFSSAQPPASSFDLGGHRKADENCGLGFGGIFSFRLFY
jgi:hypothetical protein